MKSTSRLEFLNSFFFKNLLKKLFFFVNKINGLFAVKINKKTWRLI